MYQDEIAMQKLTVKAETAKWIEKQTTIQTKQRGSTDPNLQNRLLC